MPWPNSITVRTVTGTYFTASGSPAKGRVTFTPSSRVLDQDDAVVVESALTATLNTSGSFSISLPVTDNPLLYPNQWLYNVKVKLYGAKPYEFAVYIPYGDGTSIDLAEQVNSSIDTQVTGTAVASAPQGPMGPRGASVVAGQGLPIYTIGYDGDIFIDTDTGNFYGPKTAGEWSGTPFFSANFTTRHVHTQGAATATWTITHGLGGKPSVAVVDSAGTVVVGEVRYDSNTVVTVLFTTPFSGYAYLT
jgi:hypothetical protein